MTDKIQRRSVLARLGAVGLLAGGGVSTVSAHDGDHGTDDTRTLRVVGTGPTVEFQFQVSGRIVGSSGTWEDTDLVARDLVDGQVSTQDDVYQFTGDLESFAVTNGDVDDLVVSLDGEEYRPDDTGMTELVVRGTGPTVEFQFDVTGEIVGSAETWEDTDFVARTTVAGQVSTLSDTYQFTGDLESFTVTDGRAADIELVVGDEERTPGDV